MKERNPRQRYTLMLSGNKRKRKQCNNQQGCSKSSAGASNLCTNHKTSELQEEMLVLLENLHVVRMVFMHGMGFVQSQNQDLVNQLLFFSDLFLVGIQNQSMLRESPSSLEYESCQLVSALVE
mmetsp:Transcript_2256/g.3285  ORF Transcript_2256/g.3285 Transcript_2256/m.3285 type:complete len:123 (+) Transcript_2256:51-419(+)